MLLEEIVSSEEARAGRGGEEARGRGVRRAKKRRVATGQCGKIFKIL